MTSPVLGFHFPCGMRWIVNDPAIGTVSSALTHKVEQSGIGLVACDWSKGARNQLRQQEGSVVYAIPGSRYSKHNVSRDGIR